MEYVSKRHGEPLAVTILNLPKIITLSSLLGSVNSGAVWSASLIKTLSLGTGVTARIVFAQAHGAVAFKEKADANELHETFKDTTVLHSKMPTGIGLKETHLTLSRMQDVRPTRHLKVTGMCSANVEAFLAVLHAATSPPTAAEAHRPGQLMHAGLACGDNVPTPLNLGPEPGLCALLQDVWLDRAGAAHFLCAGVAAANWVWRVLLALQREWNGVHGGVPAAWNTRADLGYMVAYAQDPCDGVVCDVRDVAPVLEARDGQDPGTRGFLGMYRAATGAHSAVYCTPVVANRPRIVQVRAEGTFDMDDIKGMFRVVEKQLSDGEEELTYEEASLLEIPWMKELIKEAAELRECRKRSRVTTVGDGTEDILIEF